MSAWTLWRLLKFASLALLVAGIVGQLQSAPEGRLRWLNRSILPGFLGLCGAGWMMAKTTGASMGAGWISGALLAGLIALWGTLRSASRGEHWLNRALPIVGLNVSLVLMVLRPEGGLAWGAALSAAAVGVGLAALTQAREGVPTRAHAARAFKAVAYLEGSSLLLMMAINMPLKKLAGISLDGDSGLIGWLHGVLVFVYLISLGVAARALGWGVGRVVLAFVASLVPGGAFVFERWVAKKEEKISPPQDPSTS